MRYEFYYPLPIHGISIKEVASPKDFCESNKCFTIYRFHGVTGSYKFNFNKFASSFLLSVLLQKDKDDPSCIDILRRIKSKDELVELKEE